MKKRLFIVGSILIFGAIYLGMRGVQQVGFQTPTDSGVKNMGESGIAATWATDFNNNRRLVGYYQNVFAGKVLAEAGRSDNSLGLSRTQYDVEVIYNIKGIAEDRIVVSLDSTKGDKLAPGTTYLFGATHLPDEAGPWYFVGFHPATKTVVSEHANLSKEQLRELVLRHARTYELLNAYPNEIPFDGRTTGESAANLFQSLSQAEKQAVHNKFAELIPPRPVPETLPPPPLPQDTTETSGSSCRDGIDNDGDRLVDQGDPNCRPYYREDHQVNCRDNKDNDLDNLTDAQDPDCAPFYPPPPQPPTPPPPPPIHVTSTPPAPAQSSTSQ